jgi:hypothetical protein
MELAGLEPATSWVRFRRNASPGAAMSRHKLNHACLAKIALSSVATVRHRYLTKT